MNKSIFYIIRVVILLAVTVIIIRGLFGDYGDIKNIGTTGAVREIGNNVMKPISEIYELKCNYYNTHSKLDWSSIDIDLNLQYYDN